MRLGRVTLLLTIAASSLVAGCIDCASGPPVTARGIGASTGSTSGLVGYALTVHVTAEPGGPPIPGAGVVLYWGNDNAADWRASGGQITAENGANGQRVVIVADPSGNPTSVATSSADRLRTDAAGTVRAHLPANRIIGLVVAADGYTEEWVPAFATGGLTGADDVTIPLYRTDLKATINDTWGPGAASTGAATNNNYAWKPATLPFGASDAVRRGYAERLAALTLALTWTNGVSGYGDLAVGLGPTTDQPSFVSDSTAQATPGAASETATLDVHQLKDARVLAASDVYVGPATRTGFVAPFGLPFTLAASGHFDTAAARAANCGGSAENGGSGLPGAHVPLDAMLPFAAIALSLLVARRRAR
ncbi:MAG: hypothetical protein ACYDCK_02080 [Thermoplasmatota archaeon]